MSLPEFIETNLNTLIEDWATHADALSSRRAQLSDAELRDAARDLLVQIALNMRLDQSAAQRANKSRGAERDEDIDFDKAATMHAEARLRHGFDINEVIAEYRALRASVLRQWQRSGQLNTASFEEMIRFNEAIDQGLTVSARRYDERAARLRELFSGALVHDLRSPLGVVMNAAELLRRDTALSAISGTAAELVHRSSIRIRRMVDDLLVFQLARLGQGLPIDCTRQDMSQLCDDAIEETRVLYPEADVTASCTGDRQGTWDGGRLSQLLANLLANAVRYGRGRITVETFGDGRWMTLKVTNEGDPIPADAFPTLFDPLTRASPSVDHRGLAAGAGLGLYICRCIASAHEGNLEVESTQTCTTFTLGIPQHVDS